MSKSNLLLSGYSAITYTDIQTFINRTLTSGEQTLVTSLITSVESYIARLCDRQFKTATDFTDVFDIDGQDYIFYNYPIKEVTKIVSGGITLYDKSVQENNYVEGIDYFTYDDRIMFEYEPEYTNSPRRALEITYNIEKFWGDDVTLAIKKWVSEMFTAKEFAGREMSNISVNGVSTGFDTSKTPAYVQKVIDAYRKILI